MFRRHPVLSLVTGVYLAFVAWITLSPQLPMGDGTDGIVWTILNALDRVPGTRWIDYADVEFIANMAMFAPIGMFFVLLFGRGRWWLAMLLPFILSCAIELAQLLVFTTRVADLRDVLSNTVGAVVGALFILIVTTPKARRIAHARAAAAREPALSR